jgi:tetratricopeptide (TPR) repeat protein
MSFWKSLFGNRSKETELDATKGQDRVSLPVLNKKYLHKSFGTAKAGSTPGPGGRYFDQAIPYWDSDDYKTVSSLLWKAILSGLERPDEAYAYNLLGQIHLKERNVPKAVESFLKCLESTERTRDATFEAAVRLFIIYGAVGRTIEAIQLEDLAKDANTRGLQFSGHAAQEISRLAKEQVCG